MGALSEKELPSETREALGDIDILVVPVDSEGVHVLSPKDAYALAVSLEPRVIIPCGLGEKTAVDAFLKEAGVKDPHTTDKLTVKRKDLEGKEGEVMVIAAS